MDKEQKKALRAQYEERKPEMGIVCWQNDAAMWIAISKTSRQITTAVYFNCGWAPGLTASCKRPSPKIRKLFGGLS